MRCRGTVLSDPRGERIFLCEGEVRTMEEDQTRQDDMMGRRRGDGTSELGRFGKKKSVVCRLVGNPWREEKRRVKQRPRPVFTLCVRRVRSFPPARRAGSGSVWNTEGLGRGGQWSAASHHADAGRVRWV